MGDVELFLRGPCLLAFCRRRRGWGRFLLLPFGFLGLLGCVGLLLSQHMLEGAALLLASALYLWFLEGKRLQDSAGVVFICDFESKVVSLFLRRGWWWGGWNRPQELQIAFECIVALEACPHEGGLHGLQLRWHRPQGEQKLWLVKEVPSFSTQALEAFCLLLRQSFGLCVGP